MHASVLSVSELYNLLYPKVFTFSPNSKDKAKVSIKNDANGVDLGQRVLKHNGERDTFPAF